jgi:HD-GYP domain-containing protein (c-di-GMP phosphodiesterase class II)
LKPLLIAALGRAIPHLPAGRSGDDLEIRRVPSFPAATALDASRPTVVLVDRALLHALNGDYRGMRDLAERAALVGVGDPDEVEPPAHFPAEVLSGFLPGNATAGLVAATLRGAFRHAAALVAYRAVRAQERERHRELAELTRVGVALTTERDLLSLLTLILSQARRITTSDAGSLYLVERDEEGHPEALRFKLSQNETLTSVPLSEFTVPIDNTSLAGYTAATHEPLVIPDVYLLPEDVSYRLNRSFDDKFGYRTKSMLVIPMTTHRDEVIGVLQLINRKRLMGTRLTTTEEVDREVLPYDERSVELVSALAAQAAVSIENSLLYENIERLFEGFVTAAVSAIEARDPATFGHSERVATMTVSLARAVDRGGSGQYRSTRFSRTQLRELRYASLLHDFGKVGVSEHVLVKEKKLYSSDIEAIRGRFAVLKSTTALEYERRRAEWVLRHGREGYDALAAELETRLRQHEAELDRLLAAVVAANEPTILSEEAGAELACLSKRMFRDMDGIERPLLTEEEVRFLTITRGNLDEQERREIEAHVTHTFRFLQQIPWTRELRDIPRIAYAHHEKLNGEGYPRGVHADEIPVQTRIMTIADIYDALTATDRPYKPAVPSERALDILRMEAKQGMLDHDLLTTFIESRVYALTDPKRFGSYSLGGTPESVSAVKA